MIPRFDEPADLQTLTRLVRDCSVSEVGRNVLLLRTDLLPAILSRPHHLRLAAEAIAPLHGAERACIFELGHGRSAVAWRGEGGARLRAALDGLDHLLADAPPGTPTVGEFTRVFTLPEDGAALLALAAGPSMAQQRIEDAAPPPVPSPALPALTAEMVDGMEEALRSANVAAFARQRLVCRAHPRGFVRAWDARFLSLRELSAELAPGFDPFGDRVLLRRLATAADRRLLALLATGPVLREMRPFSVALTVEAAVSPEFLRLDAAMPSSLRGQAVVAFDPVDILADVHAYRFAAAFLRARAFRIQLRNVSPPLLRLLDLPAFGPHLVELRWTRALLGQDAPAFGELGLPLVLSGIDEEAGLSWGRGAGVALFEGRAVVPSTRAVSGAAAGG